MHISVRVDGSARIHEPDNFRRFHVETVASMSPGQIQSALGPLGYLEGDHAFIRIAELRAALAAHADNGWSEQFESMIARAKGAGWVSADGSAIRAHIVCPT